METEGLVIILVCILAAAAISKRIQGTILTLPMLYTAFGLLLGARGLGLIFRVRWWVDTYTDPYPIYDKVNESMYAALGSEGIKVSFTTANIVHVTPRWWLS